MQIWDKSSFYEVSFPITDGKAISILSNYNMNQFLTASYADSFLIKDEKTCFLLVQQTEEQSKKMNHYKTYVESGKYVVFDEQFFKGVIFLNGKIVVKGDSILIGVYSYQLNRHGFIWGTEFRNKTVTLPG
jgi:hypothetical protein